MILLLLLSHSLVAQSRYGGDFKAWQEEQNRQFSRYLSEQDRAFSAFLKREAKLLNPEEGEEQYVAPKPEDPPVFTPDPEEFPRPGTPDAESPRPAAPKPEREPAPEPGQPRPAPREPETEQPKPAPRDPAVDKLKLAPEPVRPEPRPEPQPDPQSQPETQDPENRVERPLIPGPAVPVPSDSQLLRIDFYGRELELRYPRKMAISLSRPILQQSIADFWESLASSDHEPLVKQIGSLRDQLHLNDWGYALLIRRIGERIYPRKPDEATLFSWFVLSKSGYATSLAFTRSRAYFLVRSDQRLFGAAALPMAPTC